MDPGAAGRKVLHVGSFQAELTVELKSCQQISAGNEVKGVRFGRIPIERTAGTVEKYKRPKIKPSVFLLERG